MRDELLLKDLLSQLGLADDVLDKVLIYKGLVEKWSEKINLMSARDREGIVKKHIITSLLMVPQLRAMPHASILDLGSGAGIPGIPLKLAMPESRFLLVESRRKRASFLKEAIRQIGLGKISVVNKRLEEWSVSADGEMVDLVVSKAVGYEGETTRSLQLVLKRSGHAVYTLQSRGYSRQQQQKSLMLGERSWQGVPVRWGVWTI